LTEEPWCSALPERGLWILGARVAEPLNLDAAHVAATVRLERSRFEGKVTLDRARFERLLSFSGSTFEDGIQADDLYVGGSLLLRYGVMVRGKELRLQGVKIENQLLIANSTFKTIINANSLHVGSSLYLKNVTCDKEINLIGARIDSQLIIENSTFTSKFEADHLRVGDSLCLIKKSTFMEGAKIRAAHITSDFDLSGAKLSNDTAWEPGLDISGTIINGDLRLASKLMIHQPPTWGNRAELVLRNVRVGAVEDGSDAWPKRLNLYGFVYDRLGGTIGSVEGDEMHSRPISWYVETWLARDLAFSRQPYQQLAAVFRAAGYPDRADTVLYAARERERKENWREGGKVLSEWLTGIPRAEPAIERLQRAVHDIDLRELRSSDEREKNLPKGNHGLGLLGSASGLWLLKVTIGYGIGRRMFRVLYWVAALTALGAAVLWFTPEAQVRGLSWCLWASFDQLLPIVELNKEFGDFFDGSKGPIKDGWRLYYFAVQALAGYLLGSFVVAGLGGLTQAK